MQLPLEQLQQLQDIIKKYQTESQTGRVVNYQPYSDLQQTWEAHFAKTGAEDWDDIWSSVEAYLEDSVKTSHPQYFNQLWANQSAPSFVGDVIGSLANTSMYTYEVAPVATLIEQYLLEEMKRITGFTEGEAQVTTGGSNGNMMALMLALHRRFPEAKQSGLSALPKVAAFVSDDSHYSFDKAANTLGLGLDCLYRVRVDERGAMQMADLKQQIEKAKADGRVPLFVVGVAGTTVRGAYDPFAEIGVIAKQEDLWFHIDGAWGGAVVLSEEHKSKMDGLDLADSFVWDAHKMLGLSLMCSMFFVREAGQFDASFNLGDTSYIFHGAGRDLGPYSLQCGRRVDILKFWLEWQFYGHTGLAARIDRYMELSAYAEARITREVDLELQSERWINNICFRFSNKEIDNLNEVNRLLRNKLHQSGQSFVNVAYVGEDLTIRLILCNPELTEADVDIFFDNVLATATTLTN